MTTSDDRERGLIEGLAVGNLLGIVMEGWSRNAVRRQYPNGVTGIEEQARVPR